MGFLALMVEKIFTKNYSAVHYFLTGFKIEQACSFGNENGASESLRDSIVTKPLQDYRSSQWFHMYPIGGYYALVVVCAEA